VLKVVGNEILAHRCPPPLIGHTDLTLCANNIKLCFADFFMFGPPLLLAQDASVRL
jgi:hypothetical protein